MNDIQLYLIKAAAGICVSYAFFRIFFAGDTFYRRNRFFLLMIIILPLILPLIRISYSGGSNVIGVYAKALSDISPATTGAGIEDGTGTVLFSLSRVITLVYLIVTAFFVARFAAGVYRTVRIIKGGRAETTSVPYIISTNEDRPVFSIYPFIVIPDKVLKENDYSDILEHEKAHIRQLHSFDILIGELAVALQWFNPAIWLVRRDIRLNHEYLADSATILTTTDKKEYQYRLLNINEDMILSPITHSFSSSIKNRLVMINKKPTGNFARLKNLMVLPVLAILFISLSFRNASVIPAAPDSQFSEKSKTQMLKFIATNILYPQASKTASDTASVFVSMKVGKGGIIKECKAVNGKSRSTGEILPEIVIVGYKPKPDEISAGARVKYDHSTLVDQCIKLSGRVGEADIPEFREKDTEFTLVFRFSLK